jgi:hypothetical protein
MSDYRFCMHNDSNVVEGVAPVSLADDTAAKAFAARVIRDIKVGSPGRYDGWTMDITERGRHAGSVQFDNIQIVH